MIGKEKHKTIWMHAFSRLCMNNAFIVSASILGVLIFCAIVLPLFSRYTSYSMDLAASNQLPSWAHFFGTDELGRDLFLRSFLGLRITVSVCICATLISTSLALLLGGVSGYFGGWVDKVVTEAIDFLFAIDGHIMCLFIISIFGTKFFVIMFSLVIFSWMRITLAVRGKVKALAKEEFVIAARVIGLSDTRVLIRHIFPNIIGLLMVYTTDLFRSMVMFETGLSAIGLGFHEPNISLGTLVLQGAHKMEFFPWLFVFPLILLLALLFALNYIGDAIRDSFDFENYN